MILIKGDFLRPLKIFTIILVSVLLFLSCQDDPTSLGKDLIGNQLKILTIDSDADSLSQYSSSFLTDSLSFGAAKTLLLGNLDYVKSTMLLRFGTILPDSTVSSIEDGTLSVISSELELKPSYKIGNVSQPFNFTVHEITSEWGSAGFNSDSLSMITYEPNELTDNKNITDSLIQFNVNNELALEWLKALSGDSLANNYGMILIPQSGTNVIYGFRAFLQGLIYDNSPLLRFVVQNAESQIDTIITRVVFDVHLPEGTPPAVSEDKIQLTAGLGQRGQLFFDLSKIPVNVNINRAELVLQVDSTASVIGSPDADSLRIRNFIDSSAYIADTDKAPLRLYFDGKRFKGGITQFVQSVVSGMDNQGLQLSLSNEVTAVDRYVIYGSTYSDRTLRPKLVIYYNEFD